MKISEDPEKNKANLLVKNLIFEPKIDDTKLYKNMQNEPNWKFALMNITNVLTTDYNRVDTWCRGKNEPKTNPNEPNLPSSGTNKITAVACPALTLSLCRKVSAVVYPAPIRLLP
jgi:hypothetical protein